VANDGDGRDGDASDPGDWVSQAEVAQRGGEFFRCADSAEPSSWHGTQVSGLIAAVTHNGIGMASTAPGARVLPVRVLGKCGGRDSDIIAGMRWAAGLSVPGVPANPHPARVINLSLGGEGSCSAPYRDAVDEITAAGTVIVAAAGNSSGHAVATPASCPGVIAVAGLRHVGTKVGFSSLGSEVAISAPGGNCVNEAAGSVCLYPMLSTTDSGATGPAGAAYTDSFNASVGTSFSAPLVAGVAALLLSVDPTLTPAQVKELIQRTARPFAAPGSIASSSAAPECTAPQVTLGGRPVDQLECYCTSATCGTGMLDAAAALSAAQASRRR
jgi:serine protease